MSNTETNEVLLSVQDVDITFDIGGKKKLKAVQGANFDIYKGETFALVGESGSGKTTIGRAIMRINPLSAGQITFEGKRISGKLSAEADREVIRNIQMIFQDPAASLNERATIEYCTSINSGLNSPVIMTTTERFIIFCSSYNKRSTLN